MLGTFPGNCRWSYWVGIKVVMCVKALSKDIFQRRHSEKAACSTIFFCGLGVGKQPKYILKMTNFIF